MLADTAESSEFSILDSPIPKSDGRIFGGADEISRAGGIFGGNIFGLSPRIPASNIFGGVAPSVGGVFRGTPQTSGDIFIFGSHAASSSETQGDTSIPASHQPSQDGGQVRGSEFDCADGIGRYHPAELQSQATEVGQEEDLAESSEEEYQSSSGEEDDIPCEIFGMDALPSVPVPPYGSRSWDWPLTRHDKKTRVGDLERSMQYMDHQLLLKELAELREFRQCHEAEWKAWKHSREHRKHRNSIG